MLENITPQIITKSVPGPRSSEQLERRFEILPKALHGDLYPIVIEKGYGAMVWDLDGNRFIDWIGGIGVLNLGYSNEEVVEAVKEQSEKYFHAPFSIVSHKGILDLAEKFNEIMPCRGEKIKTYFTNSGTEANENAIKVAKSYTKRNGIICFTGAFHGRTNLMMELTANKKYSKGMGPFPAGIYRADFPDIYHAPFGLSEDDAIDYYIEQLNKIFKTGINANEVAAVIVEPLQGEGGFIPAPIKWVKKLRKICDDNGILIICDEVQSGNCRTGRYFAAEYWKEAGVPADVITTAKSMGSGLPISAISASSEIMDSVVPGTIGGTYNGNPMSCAAALKTVEIMLRDDYAKRSREIGEIVMDRYLKMKDRYSVIGDVRGLGAMIGMEFVLDKDSKEANPEFVNKLIKLALQRGLLIESAGINSNVIRFLAPLVITNEQLITSLDIYEKCIKDLL